MGAKYSIAILGGTGNEGPGLALRWAKAGHQVSIGSRQLEKAQRVAAELNQRLDANYITARTNLEAAGVCEIAVLTVPFDAQQALLESVSGALQGKVLINVNVALKPPKVSRVYIPAEGSATAQAQAVLGESVRVVGAFQNVSAHSLEDPEAPLLCDVLVCGNDKTAKDIAIELAQALGTRGIDAGPLANAIAVEALTAVLIGINLRYKVKGAGIQITGLPRP